MPRNLVIGAMFPAILIGICVTRLTHDHFVGYLVTAALTILLTHITFEIRSLKK
jgi:general stress protein CsbA